MKHNPLLKAISNHVVRLVFRSLHLAWSIYLHNQVSSKSLVKQEGLTAAIKTEFQTDLLIIKD